MQNLSDFCSLSQQFFNNVRHQISQIFRNPYLNFDLA
jgi:hypothetical protein